MKPEFFPALWAIILGISSSVAIADNGRAASFSVVDRVKNVDALTLEMGVAMLYDYQFDILYQHNKRIGSPDVYAMMMLNTIRIDNKLLYSGYQVSVGYTLWHRYVDVLMGMRIERPAYYDASGFGPELLIHKSFSKSPISFGVKLGTSFFRNQATEFNSSDTTMFYEASFTLGYRLGF